MAEPERTGPKQGARDAGGRFRPGQSGNPAGRPRGARNRATLAAAALLEGEGEALTRKAVELALDGDVGAMRLCLERILPRRQDAPVRLAVDVEEIRTPADASKVAAAALAALAAGDLSPREALAVVRVAESCWRFERTISAQELEAFLADAAEKVFGVIRRYVEPANLAKVGRELTAASGLPAPPLTAEGSPGDPGEARALDSGGNGRPASSADPPV